MIKGRMVYIGTPKAMKRGMPKVVQESMKTAGGVWHHRHLPRHFDSTASNRYGYQARTANYQSLKRRRKGHNRPLEYSGELKRAVTRMAKITGSRLTVRVWMDVGQAWYATRNWKTRGSMPDMPRELTAITHGEERELARVVEQEAEKQLNAVQDRETRA